MSVINLNKYFKSQAEHKNTVNTNVVNSVNCKEKVAKNHCFSCEVPVAQILLNMK